MKLKNIICLSLMLFLAAGFIACTKRDKLVNNAMIVQIEPAGDIVMSVDEIKELKAVIKNVNLDEVNQPVRWSISDTNLGSFSSVTSHNPTFTAENSGEGTITLSCCGIEKTVTITIG